MFTKLAYIYGMKYLNGKIYKLIDNTNGNIYIGSTCLSLKERLQDHKYNYNRYNKKDGKSKGTSSYDIIKNNDYKIELLENFPCKSKQELLRKEREYIESNKCINIVRPIITHQDKLDYIKEYIKINRDKIAKRKKEWANNNKDKINKKASEKIQCDNCSSTIRKSDLAQHKRSLKCQNYKKRFIN